MGSQAPRDAATKHTEQSTHQAAIWAALVYAGTCLTRGSRVTLTVESVAALRNLQAAPAGTEAQQEGAAQGGAEGMTPQRDGPARPAPGGANKRQRPNPRPDLKRGREADERKTREGARPSHTALNIRNKTRLEALSRRYPGKLELRAPQGATPITLRMQAQTTPQPRGQVGAAVVGDLGHAEVEHLEPRQRLSLRRRRICRRRRHKGGEALIVLAHTRNP